MAHLRLSSITKRFGDVTALKGVDLDIHDGEFFVLLGPTGAGKTTMLRVVAGLEKPDSGEVHLDEQKVNDLIPAQRDVAFVFQYYTLYPTLSVRENLAFPLKSPLRRTPPQRIEERVREVARVLHIEHLLERGTSNLSGGEMQRVAIGRAIVRRPRVFLMDEPLSNLDAKLREEMRAELAHLHLDLKSTFFYVTHDQVEAMTMADRIGVLDRGELQQVGTPEQIYSRPRNTFVARFVGSPMINLFEAAVEDGTLAADGRVLACAMSDAQRRAVAEAGRKSVLLGVRPEDVTVSRQAPKPSAIPGRADAALKSPAAQSAADRHSAQGCGASFPATIYFMQSMGAEDILNLRLGNLVLRAVAPPSFQARVGEPVYASFDMERAHLFDPDTQLRIGE